MLWKIGAPAVIAVLFSSPFIADRKMKDKPPQLIDGVPVTIRNVAVDEPLNDWIFDAPMGSSVEEKPADWDFGGGTQAALNYEAAYKKAAESGSKIYLAVGLLPEGLMDCFRADCRESGGILAVEPVAVEMSGGRIYGPGLFVFKPPSRDAEPSQAIECVNGRCYSR